MVCRWIWPLKIESFSDAVEDVKRYERSYRKLPPAHKKLEGQFILGSTTIATLFQTMTNFGPFHFQIFTLPVPALLKGFLCVVGTSLKYTVIQNRKELGMPWLPVSSWTQHTTL